MTTNQKSRYHVHLAMREAVRRNIYDPNVTLIDFGWRIRDNVLLDKEPPCIRVHVIKKFPESELEAAIQVGITKAKIDEEIAGFPVDVPVGYYQLGQRWWGWWRQPADPRVGRVMPMQGGISVSDGYRYIAGTLGGLVFDRATGDPMILSNFHVLAGSWYARPGWPIYQPGRFDGGSWSDRVARLSRDAMADNLDAAVAELTEDRQLINNQFGLAPVTGAGWAQLGMNVVKSGRTTRVTRGRVTGVLGDSPQYYSGVEKRIRNVINIMPREETGDVSSDGDSGAFWLDEDTMNVVGLHFAQNRLRPQDGLAIDILPILEALNVDIA